MAQGEEVVVDFEGNYGRSNNKEKNLEPKASGSSPSDKLQDMQEKAKGSESVQKRKQGQQQNQENHHRSSYSGESVARSTSHNSTPRYSWTSPISRTKSRLIDPPEESCANSESGGQNVPENDGNDDFGVDNVEDMPEIYKRTRFSAFSLLQWLCLASIAVALLSNLWISCFQRLKLCGLPLWQWETLILVLICGRLLSGWVIKVIVFFVERNFILRKRVLYFVYGLKNSVKNCFWLGLVLLAWHFILVNAVQKKVNDRILSYVTKVLVCLLIGTLIRLLKTILVKVFALHFHVKSFFERIREALFSQYVIETLSRNRLTEEEGEDRSVGRALRNNKKQDGEMSIKELHKLNRRNISAWNMKRMINIIMHGAFTTLDERILCSDIEDEPLLQIRSERQAKVAAQKIFQNVAQPGSQYIFLQDVMQFMRRDEALKSMNLLGAACTDQGISMSSLREWMVNAFRERRALALSLKDTKTAVDELHNMLNIIVGIVILIVWLVILGTPILHFVIFIGSQLLFAVFVFGNSCRTVFEAIIFLFVMHPFDVGDRCEVDGVQMIVEEMNILTTVFLKYDNQKVTYPNSVLATKPISNYQRSPDMGDAVDFCIHISTPLDKVATMKRRIIEYIERKNEHWHVDPMVIMKDVEDLNKLNMSVWLTHKMNYQDIKERWNRRAQLIEEMIKVFRELDVEYRLLPIDVNVRNLPPLLSNKLPSNWKTCVSSVP
ncbi:Mechanosensitive ion channel protein 8 [Spatholobus suberectus]|nr:Mechanosensitive ion channel protein 8 [Spatholobus suberectus]